VHYKSQQVAQFHDLTFFQHLVLKTMRVKTRSSLRTNLQFVKHFTDNV